MTGRAMTPPMTEEERLADYIGRLADAGKLVAAFAAALPDSDDVPRVMITNGLEHLSEAITHMRMATKVYMKREVNDE